MSTSAKFFWRRVHKSTLLITLDRPRSSVLFWTATTMSSNFSSKKVLNYNLFFEKHFFSFRCENQFSKKWTVFKKQKWTVFKKNESVFKNKSWIPGFVSKKLKNHWKVIKICLNHWKFVLFSQFFTKKQITGAKMNVTDNDDTTVATCAAFVGEPELAEW